MVEEKEDEDYGLSGVEIIDTVELHKYIVDMHFYENKYKLTKKSNKKLTKEIVRLAKIINDNNKKNK